MDPVRIARHKRTEPDITLKTDRFYGDRRLITKVLADNGVEAEMDVFGVLDANGYIVPELISMINALCAYCGENWILRPGNKEFWFDPVNERPCPMIGPGQPAPKIGHEVGKLSVREDLCCPTCRARFRITMGRMSKL